MSSKEFCIAYLFFLFAVTGGIKTDSRPEAPQQGLRAAGAGFSVHPCCKADPFPRRCVSRLRRDSWPEWPRTAPER